MGLKPANILAVFNAMRILNVDDVYQLDNILKVSSEIQD